MTVMTLALDFGASGSRAIYTGLNFKPHLYVMPPQICLVTGESVQAFQDFQLNPNQQTTSGYLQVGKEFYAFGAFAKQHFLNLQLQKPKLETAIPKALAMIGLITQEQSLANAGAIHLGIVLPYSEYSDRQLFEQVLRDALSDFKFCGIQKSFSLETFCCLPEGAGVLMQGREAGTNFQNLDVAVLMLGYRDTSLLLLNQGEFSRGETERLGFSNLVKSVANNTSKLDQQRLTAAICKAGTNINPKALLPLLNTVSDSYKDYKLHQLQQSISQAKSQYWLNLNQWLKLQIIQEMDEIIIAGGTSRYFKSELQSLLTPLTKKLLWCEELEKRIRATFPAQIKGNHLEYRLADVYGLFFYCYGRTTKTGATTDD
jgi:hypothetical protein